MKTCFRCGQKIENGSHHYDFVEYIEGMIVKIDSAHKVCWDNFLKQVSDSTEAMGIIRQLRGGLTKMGVLDPEEVIIR